MDPTVATPLNPPAGRDVNLEVFINKKLQQIHDSTSDQQPLKQQCKQLIDALTSAEFAKQGSRVSIPFPPELTDQLLSVLRSALASNNTKLIEPALACLHKLVAYAYFSGETRASGRLDDTGLVTQVVVMTSKCGDNPSAAVQLQVLKALLTYSTAEHFLPHGDCLMQTIRTAFNVAVGGSTADVRNTAKSALLQMLNTVLKRVVQQIMTPSGTPLLSPSQFIAGGSYRRTESGGDVSSTFGGRVLFPTSTSDNQLANSSNNSSTNQLQQAESSGGVQADGFQEDFQRTGPTSAVNPNHPSGSGSEASLPELAQEPTLRSIAEDVLLPELGAPAPSESESISVSAGIGIASTSNADSPTFQEHQSKLRRINTPAANRSDSFRQEIEPSSLSPSSKQAQHEAQQQADEERTARLASLADQGDVRGLEQALGAIQGDPASQQAQRLAQLQQQQIARQETPPDPRRALMKEKRAAEWRALTVAEKDAALVLGAICKMAARDTGPGASSDSYMHSGKVLALEFLVKVLQNPMHDWTLVRPEFAQQLRQPLSLVMLRNCANTNSDTSVSASVDVLKAILQHQRLRSAMKVEIGALYPLILLRPLEADALTFGEGGGGSRLSSSASATANEKAIVKALEGLSTVCGHPQILADIFVNYDCSLQAANLFERTVKALSRACKAGQPGGPTVPAATAPQLKATAIHAMISSIKSIDTWAGPLKISPESIANASTSTMEEEEQQQSQSLASSTTGSKQQEQMIWEKLHADKEIKESLQEGIAAFNSGSTSPLKALKALIKAGAVDPGPLAAVAFLKEYSSLLDPAAVGELFGDYHDESIEIMHTFIELESKESNFTGKRLDDALRILLSKFRLPGEAQKIDRIMEKFAERYCFYNPQAFPAADAAYLLAFAIIMLNTDAHNPMADGRMSAEDFVGMCMYQEERTGEFLPILPENDLKELYTRIKDNEIKIVTGGNTSSNGTTTATAATSKNKTSGAGRARLAAALGLTQLTGPFWAGNAWDKQHGVDVERKRIADLTKDLMQQQSETSISTSAGGRWHTATHAEHARPMLQVAGPSIVLTLNTALNSATSLPEALHILDSFVLTIRLAALLRLESLVESAVSSLANAASLNNPAPPMSAVEARQVAALSKLVSLGTCAEAGALGSAWSVVFRTLSQLESLRSRLVPGSSSIATTGYHDNTAGGGDGEDGSGSYSVGGQLGRLLSRMGFSGSGGSSSSSGNNLQSLATSTNTSKTTTTKAANNPSSVLSASLGIKEAPGMGAVLWAETAGTTPIDKVFTGSALLDGDSVLTFFRALCAISQEELYPDATNQQARVYLLQRVIECAYLNAGRIRLVWQKVWTVVSQHLVSAACHNDAYVAMYAVDALRQLSDKLLCRAELAGFTAQGEALRPLSAVLQSSDAVSVRELAAACVAHAVSAHAKRLATSGWRSVLEALAIAASDASPAVVTQCSDILQSVAELLYSTDGAGHTLLRECCAVARAVVENEHPAVEDLGATAIYTFQHLGRRISEATKAKTLTSSLLSDNKESTKQLDAQDFEILLTSLWASVLTPLASIATSDTRPRTADTAVAVLFQILHGQGDTFTDNVWNDVVYNRCILPILLCVPSDDTSSSGLAQGGGETHAGENNGNLIEPGSAKFKPGGIRRLTVLLTAEDLEYRSGGKKVRPEGMERVLRHGTAHLPDLWLLLAEQQNIVCRNRGIEVALEILGSYVKSPDERFEGLGVDELLGMLKSAVPAVGGDAWTTAGGFFEELLTEFGNSSSGSTGLHNTTTTHSNGTPSHSTNTATNNSGIKDGETIRRHSRIALLLLRAAAALLMGESGHKMPVEAQMRFVDAMLAATRAASKVNSDVAKRQRLLITDDDDDYYTDPLSKLSPRSAAAAIQRNPAVVWDAPLTPALIRQETEGGCLTLRALSHLLLLRGQQQSEASVLGCRERLIQYCMEVLTSAVNSSGPNVAHNTVGMVHNRWEDVVRAPLVECVLTTLSELPADDWKAQRPAVFAFAAQLVKSRSLGVRKGVRELMMKQTPVNLGGQSPRKQPTAGS